ncbi:methyltransferase domain-containing protein [Corallincola luteus]|uniref:Methyltransferase domain-containing protein n=2 Tax=Corallincola TaxID=1775176 RepID=A0A368NQC8_9GAMM|nr:MULTISPECIES: methyltransferase [Corallincola]RCU52777.1 methyltransferase domain-containing protein [Corallincola holothuriorum]TCI03278.1 methyltransferase domain-containing protein [Corallincola luteus]
MPDYYSNDERSALEARSEAQRIAFAPFIFQATIAARNLGLLKALYDAREVGLSAEELSEETSVSVYGVKVLLDMGLSAGIVWKKETNYVLSKTGFFILNDPMTKVNLDFTKDVCYEGLNALEASIKSGKPEGLKVFGDWPTIYPALSSLPEPAQSSWFGFDHYYSDHSFPEAFPIVLTHRPKTLIDIGGNTGQWARYCVENDDELKVIVVDLPEQIDLLQESMTGHAATDRVSGRAVNMLESGATLPSGADAIWMSQFLDCFSEAQILDILKKCCNALPENGYLYIMETFWDRQPFEMAALSVNATSLYFTVMANGNSRMYHSSDMKALMGEAGLTVTREVDNVGLGHTLIECRRVSA